MILGTKNLTRVMLQVLSTLAARGLDSAHKVILLKVLCKRPKLVLRRMHLKKGNYRPTMNGVCSAGSWKLVTLIFRVWHRRTVVAAAPQMRSAGWKAVPNDCLQAPAAFTFSRPGNLISHSRATSGQKWPLELKNTKHCYAPAVRHLFLLSFFRTLLEPLHTPCNSDIIR